MRYEFVKMHGTGNDFIIIEDMHSRIDLSADAIRHLCDRHFGIGADGVILVRPSAHDDALAYMHYINSDGSLAQMCGNGIRCFAKYLVDNRFALPDENVFIVDTLSGLKEVTVTRNAAGTTDTVTVDMGVPAFDPRSLPTTLAATREDARYGSLVAETPLQTPVGTFRFTCVSMGNPHAIAFVDDPCTLDVISAGSFIESSLELFPEKTNVEFAHVETDGPDESTIVMRVYERGCGETLACGTGCCATAVAATLTGRALRKSVLRILGGELHIEWRDDDHILMTGPAVTVYNGCIELADSTGDGHHICACTR